MALLLFIFILRLMYLFHRRSQKRLSELDELKELREEYEEQLAIAKMKRREGERRNLEQRAKISLASSIIPLVDRMLHDVQRIEQHPDRSGEMLQYVKELTEQINEQNNVLTHWIQLRQGELSLHIETFALQDLFDIIAKGRRSFMLKGIELDVHPTEARVKADRVLTLFMLNTLADNARKFTDKGGRVTVSASESSEYVEIAVADTGHGMDADELAHVFDHKVAGGHGFGLQNCRGIIEKYRKTSQIFSVCKLDAESRKGQGSRFFFRLPKGVTARIVAFLLLMGGGSLPGCSQVSDSLLQRASSYADSAYYSNINGTYDRTLFFADSCCHYLNCYYLQHYPESADTLLPFGSSLTNIPEIQWLHNDVKVNFSILLSLRNESAVAALALHEWQLYHYNNRIYTLLFKELSADRTLDEYCRKMQKLQTDRTVAIVLLVLIALALVVAIVVQMMQALERKATRQQKQQTDLELLKDEIRRTEMELARLHVSNQVLENCLSALKHETMYYPSRIRQLVDAGNNEALPEVVEYYRELYGILSEQANKMMDGVKLHLSKLDYEIFGDENLIAYLFEILRKLARQKSLHIDYRTKDDNYVVCEVQMPDIPATDFMPTIQNISYLLCRQIVREHGEATGCRGCGIRSENTGYGSLVIITLPKYICKTSK
jgi:signal transduction histidine kinase